MDILYISSFAVITADPSDSGRLYRDTLRLPLHPDDTGTYYSSESIDGSRHFGVWPLEQAARACFGSDRWPQDRRVPQASVEFEVADEAAVAAAGQELVEAGFDLLHPARTEPWGQMVARVQGPDGEIVGISYAPWMHR
jgi:catechol 2,3-dioxygenase-like lactoylglutathione lyase family enzyme